MHSFLRDCDLQDRGVSPEYLSPCSQGAVWSLPLYRCALPFAITPAASRALKRRTDLTSMHPQGFLCRSFSARRTSRRNAHTIPGSRLAADGNGSSERGSGSNAPSPSPEFRPDQAAGRSIASGDACPHRFQIEWRIVFQRNSTTRRRKSELLRQSRTMPDKHVRGQQKG